MARKKKDRLSLKERREEARRERSFYSNPVLKLLKPKERYVFHSDYFEVDDYVACVLTFLHNSAARDNFGPFWGINRIPAGMPEGVVTINFEQVKRMSQHWIDQHQNSAEGVAEMNSNEQARAGSATSRGRAARASNDMETIAAELNEGASYLHVVDRLLVKAPDLDTLETALSRLERLYTERFATLSAAPYYGDQRRELSTLLAPVDRKRGKGEYFTSTEFAGAYNLVTHGLEDPGGEYVGYMVGDVNNSAVLFDVDAYRHHIVIASEQINRSRNRAHVPDMWGAKLAQAALCNGHRVVHILLDKCDLLNLGPAFSSFTEVIDMNHGDVNMFEMFGDPENELSIFASQMRKLVLMAEQAYETTPQDRAIIDGSLEEIATQFYVDQRMWYENAEQWRDRLRVVGLPHTEVPRLQLFCAYLNTAYKAMVSADSCDPERLHAMNVLKTTFDNLLSNNGDLFNTHTSPVIDHVKGGRRVIYDFSQLLMRGHGVAMAQLVNIVDFAVAQLGEGDVVIVHSAENIVADTDRGRAVSVRSYVDDQFAKLFNRGGRVAYLYNSIDRMLDDSKFNRFDKADYTLLGNMSENTAKAYQEKLGQNIPPDLTKLICDRSEAHMYVRRGFDNVVFQQDLRLDIEDIRYASRRGRR